MVKRHVRDGKRHLVLQTEIVARLKSGGHPTETAEQLLANLENLQRLHREHLARLIGEGRPKPPATWG